MANKIMGKKKQIVLAIREIQMQNTIKKKNQQKKEDTTICLCRMVKTQNTNHIKCSRRYQAQKLSFSAGGKAKWYRYFVR